MLKIKLILAVAVFFLNTNTAFAQVSSPDEAAIEKINVLIPEKISSNPSSKCSTFGIICAATDFIGGFISRLGFSVSQLPIFSTRAEMQQQADAPEAVKSKSSNILDITAKDLGESLGPGVYSNSLPKEVQKNDDKTRQIEQKIEDAWFYEKVDPITSY